MDLLPLVWWLSNFLDGAAEETLKCQIFLCPLCSFVLTIKGIDEEGAKERAKGIVMDE